MIKLGSLLSLEYGCALPAEARSDFGFPVFGSNGEVGRHHSFIVPESGIVVGRKGSVGKIAWSEEAFWAIDTTYWVNCSSEDKRWLYWVLSWLPLHRLDTSTGVPGLNRNDVYEISIFAPESEERQKIAQILDTLDTAIRETEAIIAKLKAVKQGLLHDLLTRGIDANGELRPPQSEAPHLYKRSPLGWIPKEWSALTLGQACSLIHDGTHLPPARVNEGPLLLSVRNIQNGKFVLTDQDTRVSETFYSQMHRNWEVQKGDVLLAIVGATIGKTAIVEDMPKFTLQRSVAVLRGKADRLQNPFLYLYMDSAGFQSSLWEQVNQTAQPGIYLDQLSSIRIPVPEITEQSVIEKSLKSAQQKINSESDVLFKLRTQKSALMNDLLTGRVRVTPLLDSIGA